MQGFIPMHDFGRIVYMDMQKTGSTFVSEFLRFSCKLPERNFQKHAPIGDDYRPDAWYFITVRHPMTLYSSLYRYGLDRKGGIFKRLQAANLLSVYASFERFVDFLLNPRNALFLDNAYSSEIASTVGFMSYRYLLLNLQKPRHQIARAVQLKHSVPDLIRHSFVKRVFKNETLNHDLLSLSTEMFPDIFDQRRARDFLLRSTPINQSKLPASLLDLKSTTMRNALEEKERILMLHYAPAGA